MGYLESLMSEHERPVFRTHQHWIMLFTSIAVNLFIALAIIVLAAIVASATGNPLGSALALLVIFPLARFLYHYFNWVNREFIITNRRVIQIDGMVNKNVTDSSLEKVNDVKMSQSMFGRLLDYGDIEILTASELAPNMFHRIAHPIKFKTEMLNQKEEMAVDEGVHQGAPSPAPLDVPGMIAGLDELRRKGLITEDEFQKKKEELLSRI